MSRPPRSLWPAAVPVAAGMLLFGLWPGDPVANFGWLQGAAGTEPWRWFTAHFSHLGALHLGLNLAALLALLLICQWQGPTPAFWGVLLVGMLAVDAGLAWGQSGMTWYVGLSGALHGVFAWLILRGIALGRAAPLAAWPLFALLTAKVLREAALPVGSPGLSGIPLAPPAHLWGYLGGVAWMAGSWAYARLAAGRRRPET